MIEPQIPRLLRLKQILGDPKADPPVAGKHLVSHHERRLPAPGNSEEAL